MTLDQARQIFPPCWVVYMRPDDYPDGYVVRCWWGVVAEPDAFRCATLVEAREYIAAAGGCFMLGTQDGDPDVILETWL